MGLIRDVPVGIDVPLYEFLREVANEIEQTDSRLQRAIEQVQPSGAGVVIPGDTVNPDTRPVDDVENFAVLASLKFLALTWDPPDGGNNVSYTEVWRSPDNNPSNMLFHGNTQYAYFVDYVGPGSPEWFYRVRHVRVNRSASNQTSYVLGNFSEILSDQTPPNLAEVLALIEGQLSELHLIETLNSRIDLIDAPSVGLVDGLATEIGARISEISRVESEYGDADSALAQQIQNIVATAGTQVFVQATAPEDDPPDSITDGAVWYDSDDNNRAYVWVDDEWVDVADPRVDQNIAAIQVAQTAIVDLQSGKAEASVVTTLQSTVSDNTTLVQESLTAIDGIEGEYAVRIDVNGRVAGFGLINNETTSAFVVAADIFAVGQPGHADKPIFAIANVNGVPTIVLNAQTLVADLAIENAMVGNIAAEKLFALEGTIADAVIGSGHVTNLMIGNVIQSDNWNPVTRQGWRITKSTGLIEAQGITIFDAGGNAIFGSGTGFNLNWNRVNGANRPEDNATFGADYNSNLVGIPIFQDSFATVGKWEKIQGAGTFSRTTDAAAQFGMGVLHAVGAVAVQGRPEFDIPFDPSATYRVRVRARDVGTVHGQRLYAGVMGVDVNGNLVNRVGANSISTQHHVASSNADLTGSFVAREGFIQGYGSPDGTIGGNALGSPGVMHQNTVSLRPVMFLNWAGGTTELMRVDEFIIERVQPQITAANISTYIESAAIGTLFIGENQVTVPVTSRGGYNLVGNNDTMQFVTAVTLTLEVAGFIQIIWMMRQSYKRATSWAYQLRFNGQVLEHRGGMAAMTDTPSGMNRVLGSAGSNRVELYWAGLDSRVELLDGTLMALAVAR